MKSASDRRVTMSSRTLGDTPLEERVRLAAAAGFDGIGLSVEVYLAARGRGLDDRAMCAILNSHGITVTEVEFLSDWLTQSDAGPPTEKEATAFHIARTFGAVNVNVGLFEKAPLSLMAESFARLCERADGQRIALEFMPFGGIPDLATAWEMVRLADLLNAGLLIDVWHWVRAATSPGDLSPVPAERIFAIQLCDVGPEALTDMRYESLHHRLLPGQGSNHAREVLAILFQHGIEAELTAEVMSDTLLADGLAATAHSVFTATSDVLAAFSG